MKTIAEMLQERAGIITAARAILDKADAESRDLTENERNEYDSLLQKADDISRRERFESHNTELENMRIGERGLFDREPENKNHLYAETADGKKIRLFRSTEKWETAGALPDGIRADELSLGRFCRALYTGDWSQAQAEQRVMVSTTGADGGVLIPEVLSDEIIQAARVKTRAISAGAVTFKMDGPEVTLAKITGYPEMKWTEENATIDEGDLTFSPLMFKAEKIGTIIRASEELLSDAANLEAVIKEALSSTMAIALDRVCFYGNGGSEPLGLLNSPDIGSTDISSAPATNAVMGHLLDAEFELLDQNLEPSELSVLYNSTFGKTLAKAVDGVGAYFGSANTPAVFASIKRFLTNQIEDTDTATPVLFGRFSDLMIGVREGAKIAMSREEGDSFAKNRVAIRILWRGDAQPVLPANFHVLNVATS